MYENCEGVVLRRSRFSETSLVLSLFTREFGRVDALAKGARRLSSSMRGHFDLYNIEEVTIFHRPRAGLDLATDAALLSESSALRIDPLAYACMAMLAEVLLSCSMPHDPHEKAYVAFTEALKKLNRDYEPKSTTLTALFLILKDLGYMPRLDACGICESKCNGGSTLSAEHGGLICGRCNKGLPEFNSGELAAVLFLSSGDKAGKVRLPEKGRKIFLVMERYLSYVFSRRFKSFEVLEQLL